MGDASTPVERDVAVNGITLRIVTWGDLASDRGVLLVHGITANSRSWFRLGPALAERGWYAVGLDLRGRGRSGKPASGYGVPFHVNDLLALSRELGLERPNLIGHSLGARIGIWLAALYPGQLGRLALVDAGGILPSDTFQAIAPALMRLGTVYESRAAYLDAMLASPHIPDDPFWRAYYDYDADEQPGGTVISSVPKAAIDEENGVNFFTQIDALPPYIKAPTLIVRATEGLLGGERGQILPASEAERLQGQIPGSRVATIEGVNHYTILNDNRFVETIVAFLEEA